jgi:SAM-dependent methyltransferase
MTPSLVVAWRVLHGYAPAGPKLLAFLAARLAIAKVEAVDAELAGVRGEILSIGAGYGVLERYLSERNPETSYVGVELDRRRVRVAERTRHGFDRVRLIHGDAMQLADQGRYDAALAIDVLHHLPGGSHQAVLEGLRRSLKPGGICIVKDIARTPRWKYVWNRAHDRLVAGSTSIACRDPAEMAAIGESAGLDVQEARRLSPLSPYPHYLLRLCAPL